jgi:geranylgeranyl diphosphate synthase type II
MKRASTSRYTLQELHLYAAEVRPDIEQSLKRYLPLSPGNINERFNGALRYALFPGGKRLRPMLTLLGAQVVGSTDQNLLAAAAAVEYVHTSSIIFDDLPCMDNARERRDRACLHQQYGEGHAILVALALLNASYELIINSCPTDKDKALRAHQELVRCVGAQGMVAGQAVDINGDGSMADHNDEEFESFRNLKTSSLVRFAINIGAILADATDKQLTTLSQFAELLGSAYQVSDDLLDVDEDRDSGYERFKGSVRTGVVNRVTQLAQQAKDLICAEFGFTHTTLLLCQVADFVAARNR